MNYYCQSCQHAFAVEPAATIVCPLCGQIAACQPVANNGPHAVQVTVSQAVATNPSTTNYAQPAPSHSEIDLGGPVGKHCASDPPSGGSLVGWANFLRTRPTAHQPLKTDTVEFDPVPVSSLPLPAAGSPQASTPSTAPGSRLDWRGLGIGLLLGVVLCILLWTAGWEPPQALRQWLGRSAPAGGPTKTSLEARSEDHP